MGNKIEYEQILILIVNAICSTVQLNLIKENFKQSIDSVRLYERIRHLSYLLRILEKRDFLNVDNVNALKFIASTLKRNDIIKEIDKYESAQNRTPDNALQNRVLPSIETNPEDRIFSVIATEIGQKWKDLARNLGLKEGQIDELEHRHSRISDMVIEVLHYHKEASDNCYCRVQLFQALDKARRKDLSMKVQNILAMHNNI